LDDPKNVENMTEEDKLSFETALGFAKEQEHLTDNVRAAGLGLTGSYWVDPGTLDRRRTNAEEDTDYILNPTPMHQRYPYGIW
jgi:hypothetical protein